MHGYAGEELSLKIINLQNLLVRQIYLPLMAPEKFLLESLSAIYVNGFLCIKKEVFLGL